VAAADFRNTVTLISFSLSGKNVYYWGLVAAIRLYFMQIIFILIKPAVSQNIGAAARAMHTMGFSDMRLVDPQCNHLDENSWYMAHGSTDILKNARIFPTIHDATDDCDFIIGTTARKRSNSKHTIPAGELPLILRNKDAIIRKAAVIFGTEAHGLTNADLDHCHCISTIPLKRKYPSLNLGQAVMVYAYVLSPVSIPKPVEPDEPRQYAALAKKVADLLTQVGLPPSSGIAQRVRRRMAMLPAQDLHCIHSICNKVIVALQRSADQLKS
jgi:tRNA/rRNA methyltransferase